MSDLQKLMGIEKKEKYQGSIISTPITSPLIPKIFNEFSQNKFISLDNHHILTKEEKIERLKKRFNLTHGNGKRKKKRKKKR